MLSLKKRHFISCGNCMLIITKVGEQFCTRLKLFNVDLTKKSPKQKFNVPAAHSVRETM